LPAHHGAFQLTPITTDCVSQAGDHLPRHDPGHKQKAIYSLTEQGVELLPSLAPFMDELRIVAGAAGRGIGRERWHAKKMYGARDTYLRTSFFCPPQTIFRFYQVINRRPETL
jgi:hypothetical protein